MSEGSSFWPSEKKMNDKVEELKKELEEIKAMLERLVEELL